MIPNNRLLVVVLLPDRVGILRDVTGAVLAHQGNIEGIRQNVVDGFFSLVCTAAFPASVDADSLRRSIAAGLEPEASILVRAYTAAPPAPLPHGSHYVAMTRGPDRPGTIHAISSFFVDHGINIEDWQVAMEGPDVIYMAQIVLPADADFSSIQKRFQSSLAARGLAAAICHENIFRATNEVGPIRKLL